MKKIEIDTGKTKQNTTAAEDDPKRSDYDSAWKDVIEKLFDPFLAFFFPEVHKDIDFSTKPQFLNTELKTIAPHGKTGKRYADELIKVRLKDGSARYLAIFIHVEVQGKKEKPGVFQERVFVYNYRIFDYNRKKRKGLEVVSLAVLTDADSNYRPDEYCTERWGFELRMKIPLVKIIDYKNVPELKEKMEQSTNPMAMVVKAQLRSLEVKGRKDDTKFDVKRELIRECYRQGYTKKQIDTLLRFIDWIIRLPEGLDRRITEEIIKIEEEAKMTYVTSWERMAEKRGKDIGWKERAKETAMQMLLDDFPIEKIMKYTSLSEEEIKRLIQ